jgi:hypothetical protein
MRPCLSCAVWDMLRVLWTVASDLYVGKDAHEVWRLCEQLRCGVRELQQRGLSLQPDEHRERLRPELQELDARVPSILGPLAELSQAALQCFGEDARAVVENARQQQAPINRICCELHDAGFSYTEIAMLIGQRDEGAAHRIRMRCARHRAERSTSA